MRPRLLFVGAFPPPHSRAFGGNVTDCATLMASSFANKVHVIPLDSTAAATAPQSLWCRARKAGLRIATFFRLMRESTPDALLLFSSGGLSFVEKSLFAAYARATGVPALLFIRSGHFLDQVHASGSFRLLAKHLLRSPTVLLCQGRSWQQFFHDQFGIPPVRCPIVESWVATDEILALGQRRRSRISKRHAHVLFLGAVERSKGVFELLEAVERFTRADRSGTLTVSIAGEGSSLPAAHDWVRTHGMGGYIDFTGVLRGEAKLHALAAADVFVLPSHTEGLPNAMIEAMAAGLPVVVTPVGSIPDVIEHGANGLLTPVCDPASLAAVLEGLVASPSTCQRLGHAAHETALRRFAVERAANVLVSIVEASVAANR